MKTLQQQLEETYLLMRGILSEEDNKIITDILALDELSKDTLGSYIKHASHNAAIRIQSASNAGKKSSSAEKKQSDKEFSKGIKRLKGIAKATDRLTKEQKETIEGILEELELEESNSHKYAYGSMVIHKKSGKVGKVSTHLLPDTDMKTGKLKHGQPEYKIKQDNGKEFHSKEDELEQFHQRRYK